SSAAGLTEPMRSKASMNSARNAAVSVRDDTVVAAPQVEVLQPPVETARRTRAGELDLKDARVHLWQGPDGWVFGQAAKVQP
uniref:hypothetical protein n=1 Tax=Galactobacter sp. TaxID=2676125 RepID=UPI0025C1EF98